MAARFVLGLTFLIGSALAGSVAPAYAQWQGQAYLNNADPQAAGSIGFHCQPQQFDYVRKLCIKDVRLRWRHTPDNRLGNLQYQLYWSLDDIIDQGVYPERPRLNRYNAPHDIQALIDNIRLVPDTLLIAEVIDSDHRANTTVAWLRLPLPRPFMQNRWSDAQQTQWSQILYRTEVSMEQLCQADPARDLALPPSQAKAMAKGSLQLINLKLCRVRWLGVKPLEAKLADSCDWLPQRAQPQCSRDVAERRAQQKLQDLKRAVLEDIDAGRISVPKGDNALEKIEQIRMMHRHHPLVEEMRQAVVKQLVASAQKEMATNRMGNAVSYLNSLREHFPESPAIKVLERDMEAQESCYVVFQKRCQGITMVTPSYLFAHDCPAVGTLTIDHVSRPAIPKSSREALRKSEWAIQRAMQFAIHYLDTGPLKCHDRSDWRHQTIARFYPTRELLEARINDEAATPRKGCAAYFPHDAIRTFPNEFCSQEELTSQ